VIDEQKLIERLKARDEIAFVELVERYYGYLFPLANFYVSDKAVAEEIVQDAWMAVLKGIDRFEGRASFKTWISRIVMNLARTRGVRESRMVTFAQFTDNEAGRSESAVDPSQFQIATDDYPDHWSVAPRSWNADPETQLLTSETMMVLNDAVGLRPEAQRLVLTMRDVNGYTPEEVCNILSISETNQRVLLHRARSKVRGMVENHYSNSGRTTRDESRNDLQGTDGLDNGIPGRVLAAN
jgi:RNA polymerase sigma-70 factor (ECF subfamily)